MPSARRPGAARVSAAIAILAALGVLTIVGALHPNGRSPGREEAALLTGLVLLVAAVIGLCRGRRWGRWLGLAVGVVCTLFGGFGLAAILAGRSSQSSDVVASMAMTLIGPVLLMSLSGRIMFDRFDRPAGTPLGARASLVRWAAITNLASFVTLALLSFAAFEPSAGDRSHWHLAVLSAALVFGGALLLARGKTAGLLVAAVASSAEVLLATSFQPMAARLVFAALLLPGLVLVAAVAVAYTGPIWRFVRPGRWSARRAIGLRQRVTR